MGEVGRGGKMVKSVLVMRFLAIFVVSGLCNWGGFVEARQPLLSIVTGKNEAGYYGAGESVPAVSRPTFSIDYHSGPLLTGTSSLMVNIVWYGAFSVSQRSVVSDFFSSFQVSPDELAHPSVSSWWKTTSGYKDFSNAGVMPRVEVAGEVEDAEYSLGRELSRWEIEFLITKSLATFTPDSKAIYLVLTADDVVVDGFCRSTCASHSFLASSALSMGHQLPYAWVGNAATQCPGKCAWPFAVPDFGPRGAVPLVAPNGDVGMDGMIINIANMLAGTATDPYINGFFQGDAGAPLESATACAGIFGEGAYPGHPGELAKEMITGASYNVEGINGRKFLLPALWDPVTRTCAPPS